MKIKKKLLEIKTNCEPYEIDREISIAIDERIKFLSSTIYHDYASGNITDAQQTCDLIKKLIACKVKIVEREVEDYE